MFDVVFVRYEVRNKKKGIARMVSISVLVIAIIVSLGIGVVVGRMLAFEGAYYIGYWANGGLKEYVEKSTPTKVEPAAPEQQQDPQKEKAA